jgi:hypothetical protein
MTYKKGAMQETGFSPVALSQIMCFAFRKLASARRVHFARQMPGLAYTLRPDFGVAPRIRPVPGPDESIWPMPWRRKPQSRQWLALLAALQDVIAL